MSDYPKRLSPHPEDNEPGVGDPDIIRALEGWDPPAPATRPDRRIGVRRTDRGIEYAIAVSMFGDTLTLCSDIPPAPYDLDHIISIVLSGAARVVAHNRDHPPAHLREIALAAGHGQPVPV